jgi:hypothetical protein
MATKEEASTGGLGLGSLIFIVFLTLKLGGWGVVATWSWWWIFSPFWIPILVVIAIAIIAGIIAAFVQALNLR